MRAHRVEPRIEHTVVEYPTQMAMVAAGMGLAMVPRLGQDPLPAGVVVVPLRPVLTRTIYAVWRTDTDRRPAVRHAVAALRSAGASLQPPGPDGREHATRPSTDVHRCSG
jgi:DNA-binding transcriptional LysR family regulator